MHTALPSVLRPGTRTSTQPATFVCTTPLATVSPCRWSALQPRSATCRRRRVTCSGRCVPLCKVTAGSRTTPSLGLYSYMHTRQHADVSTIVRPGACCRSPSSRQRCTGLARTNASWKIRWRWRRCVRVQAYCHAGYVVCADSAQMGPADRTVTSICCTSNGASGPCMHAVQEKVVNRLQRQLEGLLANYHILEQVAHVGGNVCSRC